VSVSRDEEHASGQTRARDVERLARAMSARDDDHVPPASARDRKTS
jgi:hypothetical protein